mmetsp:Transcript_22379/g.37015  ORF Transcript_22379/g.37015 Transcript_22379/m.37015 type:complete len:209 (+) Transcript_22379:1552-2178(+)
MKFLGRCGVSQLTISSILTSQGTSWNVLTGLEFTVWTIEIVDAKAWFDTIMRIIGIAFSTIGTVESFTSTIHFARGFTKLSNEWNTIFIHGMRTIAKELFVAVIIGQARNASSSIVTLVISITRIVNTIAGNTSPSMRTRTMHAIDIGTGMKGQGRSIVIGRMIREIGVAHLAGCGLVTSKIARVGFLSVNDNHSHCPAQTDGREEDE